MISAGDTAQTYPHGDLAQIYPHEDISQQKRHVKNRPKHRFPSPGVICHGVLYTSWNFSGNFTANIVSGNFLPILRFPEILQPLCATPRY